MTERKIDKVWKCSVQWSDEEQDYVVQFPDDMLAAAGWEPGKTDVQWQENEDGSFSIVEVKKDGIK